MSIYPGRRLAFDGNLCTVRYLGPLVGAQGTWLGVEWDDPTRGKHDGTHKGQRMFTCLSNSQTAASFIRPTRTPDRTRTVLDAIKHKYEQGQSNGSRSGPGYQIIEISKKKVEEVGFDKIKQQMSQLGNLKIALIDQLSVVGLQDPALPVQEIRDAQQELVAACPNITELDLGYNLFETWQEIVDVCSPMEKLRLLKCSGLRLRSFESSQQLLNITELHLNECLLRPGELLDLLSIGEKPAFPNLRTLWLSHNDLNIFHVQSKAPVFRSVKTLVLENNKFTTLVDVATACRFFPNVDNLSLQDNLIVSAGSKTLLSATLETLNLASNDIADFRFVDALPNLFPNLTSLRISRNALYDQLANKPPSTASNGPSTPNRAGRASDAPFYLTLARIPHLRTLNYTTLTTRDREEGEIYYLSLADKDIRATLSGAEPSSREELLADLATKYPLYGTLCTKYERSNLLVLSTTDPSLLTAPKAASIDFAANASLAGRLVTATFYISHHSSPLSNTPVKSTPSQISPSEPSPNQNNTKSLHQTPDTDSSLDPTSTFATATATAPTPALTRPLPRTTPVYTLKSLLARHFDLAPLQFKLTYESEELDPEQVTTTKLWGSSVEAWVEWGKWDCDVKIADDGDVGGGGVPNEEERGGDAERGSAGQVVKGDVDGGSIGHEEGTWVDGGKVLLRGGTRWRKREVEILDGMRGWGDYLDADVRAVRVRVEPF